LLFFVFYSNSFSFKMSYKTIFNWMNHEALRVKWCKSNQACKLNGLSEMQIHEQERKHCPE